MMTHRKNFIKGILILPLLFCLTIILPSTPLDAREKGLISIEDIRYSLNEGRVRVVIELSDLPGYKVGELTSPDRLFIDLKGVRLKIRLREVINKGGIKSLRSGQFRKDTARVVFDLASKTPYRVFTLTSPPRLVIDFGKEERNPFYRERKIVVIDPGHGGDDPGAIGPRGLREKDVTLDMAKRLKRILEETYNLEVYLTRDSDRFISLKDRTLFANRKKADLFVSIHANASPRKNTRGTETYLLNWTNNREALRVAARENRISVEKMKESRSELGMILTSLERESKRDESLKLAHFIQNSLISRLSRSYSSVTDLGVKQALFYVLVGAEMPSVLVEVAFISNPREERLLRSRTFRQRSAEAMAKGIYRYILSLPDAPKLAMNERNLPEL
ncbi:MAG: N-acetylmuramoyl-L-alanine amidase [Nitrospirae bacterium]|nr:MAG: N-acetylmuramoyl-L-alanine amidase [Nitrospirota bacterium]